MPHHHHHPRNPPAHRTLMTAARFPESKFDENVIPSIVLSIPITAGAVITTESLAERPRWWRA